MPIAAIGAVATIGSAVIGSNAARKASRAQAQAAAAANAEQSRQYEQTRADFAPFREAGYGALNRLNQASSGDLSGFTASPDYNFRRTEGTRGIGSSFAARGGAASGNALAALADFNSGLASGEYGNWWNRQAGLVNAGQGASATTAQAGENASNIIANNLIGAGDARASGLVAQGNVWGNALGGLAGIGMGAYDWWKNRKTEAITA